MTSALSSREALGYSTPVAGDYLTQNRGAPLRYTALDADDRPGYRAGTRAHPAAVVARLYEPAAIGRAADNLTDVMAPDDDGADLR